MNAIFGIAAYDVSDDAARSRINAEVRGKAIKATESVLIFDWTFKDEIVGILRKHADPKTDSVFEAQRFNKDDEAQTKAWVRRAAEKFFEEVGLSMRRTVERAERELGENKIGVLDLMDRATDGEARARQKIDDFMLALATFRLDGEYASFKKAYLEKVEAERAAASAIVAKNATKLQKEVQAVNDEAAAEAA